MVRKKGVKKVSEGDFRVLLGLLLASVLVAVLSIASDYAVLAIPTLGVILFVGLAAPDSTLASLERKISLSQIGPPLWISTFLFFAGYIALLRLDEFIWSAVAFSFFVPAALLSCLQIGQKERAHSDDQQGNDESG